MSYGLETKDQTGNLSFSTADSTWTLLSFFNASSNVIATKFIPGDFDEYQVTRNMVDQVTGDDEAYIHTYEIDDGYDIEGDLTIPQPKLSTMAAHVREGTSAAVIAGPIFDDLESSLIESIFFKPDGTKLFVLTREYNGSNMSIKQYNLTTPWDITTMVYAGVKDLNTPGASFYFSPDGNFCFILCFNPISSIFRFVMSTPWDITTLYFSDVGAQQFLTISGREAYPTSLSFRPDGMTLYVHGRGADVLTEYSLTQPWDITPATVTYRASGTSVDQSPAEIAFSTAGDRAYVLGSSNYLQYYDLTSRWDVTTEFGQQVNGYAIILSIDTLNGPMYGGKYINFSALAFNADMTRLFLAGRHSKWNNFRQDNQYLSYEHYIVEYEFGETDYTHLAYADDSTGNGFVQHSSTKEYVGTYTDNNVTESSNPSDYSWEPVSTVLPNRTPIAGKIIKATLASETDTVETAFTVFGR